MTPLLDCVEAGNGGLVAHFGYRNSTSSAGTIEVGLANMFAPAPENRGQPTTFEAGTHAMCSGAVRRLPRVAPRGQVRDGVGVVSHAARRSIRIDKALDPENDPGRFDLLLNGEALAIGVGHGGTTHTST